MISTWACLASACKEIPPSHEYLVSAKKHLSIAVECADNYTKTWHSIYWNGSRESTKRRVREQLNNLAFDYFTHFMIASKYLDQYAFEMDEQGQPLKKWWGEVNLSLSLAYGAILKEHDHQIYHRQLRLLA